MLTKDMVEVKGGRYLRGDTRVYPGEEPVSELSVDSFWIDSSPVTVTAFRRFVKATGYTTTAEQKPGSYAAEPGSLLFVPTDRRIPLTDLSAWWVWSPGTTWQRPRGPGSDLRRLDQHPVVHVSLIDALAYADWAGKRLPSEVEWEYAARGGLDSALYAWGDEFMPKGRPRANTWQGEFPLAANYRGTTQIKSYPPNGYGLYDVIGNVWEWTATPWGDPSVEPCCMPRSSVLQESDANVVKGGSFLCSPHYCKRYRPAARQEQTVFTSTSHIGFRCAL